jgi:hypothetical protein
LPERNAPVTPGARERFGRPCRWLRFAASHAGALTEIDEVIGRPHRVFVALYDDTVLPGRGLGERIEQARRSRG